MDKKIQVKRIFDDISNRYDFLNHLLSLGIDFYWRKRALQLTQIKPNAVLLDIACGTGDFSNAARKFGVKNIVGADFSYSMLSVFKKKFGWSGGRLFQCTAEKLPFSNSVFTNSTVAFGVRNFYDVHLGIKSIYHALRDGGKLTILEFALPQNKFIKFIYNFYFNKILPRIGKMVSKDKEAYSYLPESVSDFEQNIDLQSILKSTGFKEIEKYELTFGIVEVYIAKK